MRPSVKSKRRRSETSSYFQNIIRKVKVIISQNMCKLTQLSKLSSKVEITIAYNGEKINITVSNEVQCTDALQIRVTTGSYVSILFGATLKCLVFLKMKSNSFCHTR